MTICRVVTTSYMSNGIRIFNQHFTYCRDSLLFKFVEFLSFFNFLILYIVMEESVKKVIAGFLPYSHILSQILEYSWVSTQAQYTKLDFFHFKALRCIVSSTWKDKLTMVEILKLANQKFFITSIETQIRFSRLKYFGHLMRLHEDRLPKRATHEAH